MHAVIISGGSIADRDKIVNQYLLEWQINPFDCIKPGDNETSIGIAAVKILIHDLNRMPQFSPYNAALISRAELLTVEAQNALLKTLEEPPPHGKIIIVTQNIEMLLPTIKSRCQIIAIEPNAYLQSNQIDPEFQNLLVQSSVGKKLKLIEKLLKIEVPISDFRVILIRYLYNVLLYKFHLTKIKDGNLADIEVMEVKNWLKKLIVIEKYLRANINPKTAFDILAL